MWLCSALRETSAGGRGLWKACPRPSAHFLSVRAAEPRMGCDEAHQRKAPDPVPFSGARIGSFFQQNPELRNPFLQDALLQGYLRRHLPEQEVFSDLTAFGDRLSHEVDGWGRECELNPPRLVPFDPWGRRVDHIVTSPAWKRMKELSAREGLVAIGYERRFAEWSRVYQMCKLYLFSPSSGLFTCPLAMTDGAAKVIQTSSDRWPVGDAFRRLTSRQPQRFWTSGQWMTERRGGSDVASGTETVATVQSDGSYRLHGFKWFTSATDADMALTLARVQDASGRTTPGSRGLTLFYTELLRDEDGGLRGVQVQRLKDKLGTRQPSCCWTDCLHTEILQLCRDFSSRRAAFGKLLRDHALHVQTLARMEVEARGAFLLVMDVCRLLGREESGRATPQDSNLLRLLTPVVKLYTGKQAVSVVSEGLESFGGQGYIEDTGLPGILRDAQVLSIWEGTTNVLSLDVLRCMDRSSGRVLHAFSSHTESLLAAASSSSSSSSLSPAMTAVHCAMSELQEFLNGAASRGGGFMQAAARDLAYTLARIYTGALLIDQASWDKASPADIYAALRWCEQDLCPVATKGRQGHYDDASASRDAALVFEMNG